MLENNFCCVRIADLSNSVFVSMETMDITLQTIIFYMFKTSVYWTDTNKHHSLIHFREVEIFCKKCSCTYLLKKTKVWDKKHFFSKKSKRLQTIIFFICFRQVSIEQIQTSIIHIAPCSQEIIDNENPIFLRFVFLEDAKWGCLVAMVTIIVFLSMATIGII